MLKTIAEAIAARGGRSFYVGGYVRDLLMGKKELDPEDKDIEVYYISIEELTSILLNYGETTVVGKSFPVIKIKGHHKLDFTLIVSPDISFKEACGRRDFTINSMMMDILTGEITDFHNGKKDLENHIIRHTSEKVFKEDPLRAYRACQFAGRFNFTIHSETIEMIKNTDLTSINKTRIYEELRKLLLLAPKPSVGLRYLQETEILRRMHPLLFKLIGCEQSIKNHPEGDVWKHILLVADEAARLKDKSKNPEALMFAALLHDIGKPRVTRVKDDKVTAYGHDVVGEKLADSFMREFTGNTKLIRDITVLVREHMHPVLLYKSREQATDKTIRKLVNRVNLKELLLLAEADFHGRKIEKGFEPVRDWLLERISCLGLDIDKKIKPLVRGRDLLQLGMEPGPDFTEVLDYAFELQMEGKEKNEIMQKIMAKQMLKNGE